MKHIAYVYKEQYTTALLIKDSSFNRAEIQANYPIDWENTICFPLAYENNKAPVSLIKEALKGILEACSNLGITTLLVCDTNYFKVLVKASKAEPLYGSVCDCKLGKFKAILAPNWSALFYNPAIQQKIDLAVDTLNKHLSGTHIVMGTDVIKFSDYPTTEIDIQHWLYTLLRYPALTCDTETTSLCVVQAELLTISFAWNQHEGIAFIVDNQVKTWLKEFFDKYTGTVIYHNSTYDISILCRNLYMDHLLDYAGLYNGLDVLTKNIEDTKIITYLATNSTAGNDLKLKNLALTHAGNYGILDDELGVSEIPKQNLLTYNLTDTISTWFVYNTYKPKMIQDNQLDIYTTIMLPSVRSIVHMQLIGFPMDRNQIDKTDKELQSIQDNWLKQLHNSKLVKEYEWKLQKEAFTKKNNELKTKYIPLNEFKTTLNPNSGKQVSGLLFDHMKLPILNKTDSGLPSTDRDTLEALYNQLIVQYGLTEEDLK